MFLTSGTDLRTRIYGDSFFPKGLLNQSLSHENCTFLKIHYPHSVYYRLLFVIEYEKSTSHFAYYLSSMLG